MSSAVADALRVAGADVVDQSRPPALGQRDQSAGDVADVDEVAAGVEVARRSRPSSIGSASRAANRPNAWFAGCPGRSG